MLDLLLAFSHTNKVTFGRIPALGGSGSSQEPPRQMNKNSFIEELKSEKIVFLSFSSQT
jgi:hypothetical protein